MIGTNGTIGTCSNSNSSSDDQRTLMPQTNMTEKVPRGRTPLYHTRFQVATNAPQPDIPIYTSTVDWERPISEADFLYRRQLSALRQRKTNVQRLAIFDFDNTLFKSPQPNPRLWDSQLNGMLKSTDLGWFQDARTLSPPYMEYTDAHWMQSTVRLVKTEARRDDTLVVLLTGRSHAAYRPVILGLLERSGLRFDIVILKETPTRQSPLVSPAVTPAGSPVALSDTELLAPKTPLTFDYKMGVVEDMIAAFAEAREILMWDDRIHQCSRMQEYLDALAARSDGRITTADVYHVPPETIYMREANERGLVNAFVTEYNNRVRARLGDSDPARLPVGALEMSTYPSFAAIFLTSRSKELLQKSVRSPRSWVKSADHMSIVMGAASDEELLKRVGAVMGEHVELEVDSIGTIANTIIAVRVSQVRPRSGPMAPQTFDTPHITVAYNEPEGIQPAYAKRITKWRPLNGGRLALQGVVGVHQLTTASIVRPIVVKDDVSIGGLVFQRWPELSGRDIGIAVSDVRRLMGEQGVENLEANRSRIAEIIDSLFSPQQASQSA
ncbi:hypothetical protein GGF43_000433 [Coemansia sp. RSA 2618]|nr:hypothetical protein GGF43_000433 [Coemansia sp. RSA 2618]